MQRELEQAAKVHCAGTYPTSVPLNDPTLPWRYPSRYCTPAGGAAFALFTMHFIGIGTDKSISKAAIWLKLAAESGYTVAIALCAKFNQQWNIGLSGQTCREWLEVAARNGSRPALKQLNAEFPKAFEASIRWHRTSFWHLCSQAPNEWLDALREDSAFEVKPFLEPRANLQVLSLSKYDGTPLHYAAMVGSVPAVEHLLNIEAFNINSQNRRGETALFLACRSGHTEVIDVLLKKGADATISNMLNENGLHWLYSFDNEVIFEYAWKLLEGGMNLHQEATLDEAFMELIGRQFFYRTVAGMLK